MIWRGNMNPTKSPFFLLPFLWFRNLLNAATCRSLMMIGYYHLIIALQNRYIRYLERYNDYAQSFIARAYIRAAKGHFRRGELIQVIDKCMMAIYTYKYNGRKAFRLCAKAYKVLPLNCPDFTQNGLWINELSYQNRLLQR